MGCGGRASGDCTRPVRGCLGEETRWNKHGRRGVHLLCMFVSVHLCQRRCWGRGPCRPRLSPRGLAAPHCFQPPGYNCFVGRSCPEFLLDIKCFQCWVKQEVSCLLPERCAYGKPVCELCLLSVFSNNHISTEGALHIAAGLEENKTLKRLNVINFPRKVLEPVMHI